MPVLSSLSFLRPHIDFCIWLNPLQCDFMPPQPGPFGQQPNPFTPQAALFYGQQPQFSQAATDTRRGSHGTTRFSANRGRGDDGGRLSWLMR
ncbi:hypothetical protein TELCIR_03983 [Teladorsagia circumcincta]|uniref:Uncharacterized protein n=1 Tax=Teladorsagia circumcincta TaxID=45464 RepID=A0A2G9UUU6_TELCI|nr:hypothetical protein TELCIR_03983 [Teladorsagia circumcincta]